MTRSTSARRREGTKPPARQQGSAAEADAEVTQLVASDTQLVDKTHTRHKAMLKATILALVVAHAAAYNAAPLVGRGAVRAAASRRRRSP